MDKKGKLELTWVGKYEEEKLEPRILIEDKSKSYGESNTENMLIHGDNLLALKALENKYTGMIKCIYIDPPYNTGAAFEHYDDNLEHSIWLGIMKKRLEILRNLLAEDGTIWIQIDDEEGVYVRIYVNDIEKQKEALDRLMSYRSRFLQIYEYQKQEDDKMAALHAKLIVSDVKKSLVSSANLSYHGMQGNIEMGFLIESHDKAKQIEEVMKEMVRMKVCGKYK